MVQDGKLNVPVINVVCVGTPCMSYTKPLCSDNLCSHGEARWVKEGRKKLGVKPVLLSITPNDVVSGAQAKVAEIGEKLEHHVDNIAREVEKFENSRLDIFARWRLRNVVRALWRTSVMLVESAVACQRQLFRCKSFYEATFTRALAELNASAIRTIIAAAMRGYVKLATNSAIFFAYVQGPGTSSTANGDALTRHLEELLRSSRFILLVPIRVAILPNDEEISTAISEGYSAEFLAERLKLIFRSKARATIYAVNKIVGDIAVENSQLRKSVPDAKDPRKGTLEEVIKKVWEEQETPSQESIGEKDQLVDVEVVGSRQDQDTFDNEIGELFRRIIYISSTDGVTLCRDASELLTEPREFIAAGSYDPIGTSKDGVLWPRSRFKANRGAIGTLPRAWRDSFIQCGNNVFLREGSFGVYLLLRTPPGEAERAYRKYLEEVIKK